MQQENRYIENAKFNITEEQIEKLRPYLPNVDELRKQSLHEFLCELDDAIIGELDEDYEDTDASIMLQNIYDEIYEQNKVC